MQRQPFNQDWRFHLGDSPLFRWRTPDDSTWPIVDLPHDWSIELDRSPDAPSKASNGFFQMGRAWYRKTFTAPADWQGQQVFIEFEGVYMNAEVSLNGNLLGRHPYGYTTFHYDLTPYLKIGEENTLTVVVDNDCQLNSRWYSGSGIYRYVWLMVAEPVHVAHWGVSVTTPEVSPDAATVKVETTVENATAETQEATVHTHLVSPTGVILSTATSDVTLAGNAGSACNQTLEIADPALWSPDLPSLYRIETEIESAGTVTDTASTPFGVRTLAFSAEEGFLLNGVETKLRGGCVHHDNGVMGAAAYRRSEERKVEVLKASGYNAVRCAHNPPSPAFLDACDRLGMLVIDEAFDCWREGKNPYDYHVAFEDWWQRDLDSMVLRDRNHPSVIMWSIGNEVGERNGTSDGAAWAQRLADRVRELDPTRPVTSGVNGLGMGEDPNWPDTDALTNALDVCGYNYQERQYRPDHERLPDRVIYGSESTAGEAFEHWQAVEELPYVIGDFVWTSLDYLGEAGIGRVYFDEQFMFLGDYPWHQANCGDLDLCGFKRPQSYYRDILWNRGSPLYIAVHDPLPEGKEAKISYWGWPLVRPSWTWPGHEGETFTVDVYSACERVELLLSGDGEHRDRSLGSQPSGREERHIATFEVPYEPGTLQAKGYNGDEHVATWELQTVGPAVGLRLTPDRNRLRSEPDDLSFVTVEVVDKMGRVDPNADHEIYFTVQGEGEIAAVGNGNPVSEESYRGNRRRAFQGRALVVVKTQSTPGKIRLRAQADNLETAQITLTVAEA
jgi:beta-galactosidase